MKQIGLFFGSFNPVHQGHLILANYLVEETALEEVWFVITPQSPFKQKQRLLDNHHRLALVEEAIEGYPKLKVSTSRQRLWHRCIVPRYGRRASQFA